MWLSDTSVKRPVFAAVVSLLLFAFGLMSFDRMSLREYPNVDPPIVTITTDYLGASSEVVDNRITKLIEDQISGVAGIDSIDSTSSDGRSSIKVEFSIDRDTDDAANDIRDRVSRVINKLPEQADPPRVQKADSDASPILWFNLASDRMTVPQLTDYAERYIVDRFSVLDGVANVRVGGGQTLALRIWLNPQKMAVYGLTTQDVENQLRSANVELPIGSLQGSQVQLSLHVDKPMQTVQDFKNLIVKQDKQIGQVTLGDIAQVYMGAVERRRIFNGNGIPMVGIGIVKQSTANTLTVAKLARDRKDLVNKTLPKGLKLHASYDASVFVQEAIDEVYKTFAIALALVVGVMLVFLRSFRAAMVPMVTLPVSIMATFWVLWMLGFSVNLLTLLALVLAIGLVVDDAIVVLENTQRHIEMGHKPIAAAFLGTRQVGFAVLATTMVLVAVFMPIGFLEGNIGRLFSEFAVTLAVAVMFSMWVALTLSPALASVLLKGSKPKTSANQTDKPKKLDKRLFWFRKLLIKNLRYPWLMLTILAVLTASMAYFGQQVPKEYAPKEDRGVFFVMVKGPEGATFDYMQSYMAEIEKRLMPLVNNGEAKRLLVRAPRSFSNSEIFNSGFVIVVLNDWSERRSAFTIMKEVRQKLSDLTGVKAIPVMRSAIGGRIQKPVQFVIGGPSYAALAKWKDQMDEAIAKTNPGLNSLDWDFEPNKPQLRLKVDYDKAKALGITYQDISETLQTLLGSKNVTTIKYNGEEYDIILKADSKWFESPQDLEQIYLRSSTTNGMVPLSMFVSAKVEGVASSLYRYNRIKSITLSAKLDDGYSLGQALDYLNKLTRKTLPEDATIDYKGQSKDFQSSTSSMVFVFLFGLVVIFLVLSAQFESFIQPLVIMLTVPLALAGGVFAMKMYGLTFNIYSEIAMVMLLGLATKNGILIVEFTNQLRDKGLSLYTALVTATQLRFRPIIMTSITTVAGTVPLILSSGAGAESRQILGEVLFWGVTFSTLLSLFVIPIAYALLAKRSGSPLRSTRKLEAALQNFDVKK
ncbi:efflux RND transporter permease subunit [Hydrogenovibrio kuenenii]|uniref:efflux RND transporter permease subunit n=1 Tax=Hydrogenovibrio kuenenii TaxID=63658 RepID=UPI00046765A1|nr:efflux RND transporter permease subunit [Hydrogenovibrio kuenenii]